MRYLTLTYYKKPTGQIDETLSVLKHLRNRDMQTASVILDFKDLKVLKASVEGNTIPKDWDTIIGYYHKHYAATVERMFRENGWEVVKVDPTEATDQAESAVSEEPKEEVTEN